MVQPTEPKPKRPYKPPSLVMYGAYRQLTQGGGGTAREPGGMAAPKTKATGTA